MPLRCLLFSSNEEIVQPIWQVLTDLGIEGEYCRNAVDAVGKVTTQSFQIVITDWDDQPEAGFLLKTARELKAAQRPLTLAIVGDDARLPEALQAGANSVLLKPIRADQVRDTMGTACELLRSKLPQTTPASPREATETAAMAAAAAAATSVAPSTSAFPAPASVTQAPEKTFRAGEFLQSPSTAPGAQFDTDKDNPYLKDNLAGPVDALSELEPMAAAVETTAPPEPEPEPQTPLTGWASLQARLMKSAPAPATEETPAKGELLSYAETPSSSGAAGAVEEIKSTAKRESEPEAALFAYIAEGSKDAPEVAKESRTGRGKVFLAIGLAVACTAVVAVPRFRQLLPQLYRNAAHAGGRWLNPPPAPLPPAVVQHDSFGQSGDEYNLPVASNIPDATTDPSQIRVVPVVDPTVKPGKGGGGNNPLAPESTGPIDVADQSQIAQSSQGQPAGEIQVKDAHPASAADAAANPAAVMPSPVPAQTQAPVSIPVVPAEPQVSAPPPVRNSVPQPRAVSISANAGIPSSLKSQLASTTPEASGTKPDEAAMSSIEPVKLPNAAVLELQGQPVEPAYPATAHGQSGNVVLQVLIGRDGAVQDAKFLQGSLVFARGAIDTVKQWRFKPYLMNGRAVSVQSTITLSFKPPA